MDAYEAHQANEYYERAMGRTPDQDLDIIKRVNALWVTPDGDLMPVDYEHYRFAREEMLDELTRDNINKGIKEYWRKGETKDAMEMMFGAGWIRLRRGHEYSWDIHGLRLRRATGRGKLRSLLNKMLELGMVTMVSEVNLLSETEGWWADPSYQPGGIGQLYEVADLL